MTPAELKEFRKNKKMTQAQFSLWLGCSKPAVVAWEIGRNVIPEWVSARIKADNPSLNPVFTLDEFKQIQAAADSQGISVDDWIANIVKKAIKLIIFLIGIAHLTRSPTDWTLGALAQSGATGLSWFGRGTAFVLGTAWDIGGALLAAM